MESTGGLCSLALRLAEEDRGRQQIKDSLTAHVPPSWTPKLLKMPEPGELGVLIQASALSAFRAAGKTDTPNRSIGDIRRRYADEMDLLVRRLILIAVGPPTPRNIDAQVMLGSLASYSYKPMKEHLEYALRSTPLGFRVWRAITKLIKLSPEESAHSESLKGWVRNLVLDSEDLRETSLYPGRSLDLELAIKCRRPGPRLQVTGWGRLSSPGHGTGVPRSGNVAQRPWAFGSGPSAKTDQTWRTPRSSYAT